MTWDYKRPWIKALVLALFDLTCALLVVGVAYLIWG